MEKITIVHPEYGKEEGVTASPCGREWMKNGAHYVTEDGWREVQEPHWVNVTREVKWHLPSQMLMLGEQSVGIIYKGFYLQLVDHYALPDDLEFRLEAETRLTGMEAKYVVNFLQQFRQPSFLINRKAEA